MQDTRDLPAGPLVFLGGLHVGAANGAVSQSHGRLLIPTASQTLDLRLIKES